MAEKTVSTALLSAASYNTMGIEVDSSEWVIYMEDMRKLLLNILSKEIDGIRDVSYRKGTSAGEGVQQLYKDGRDYLDMFGNPLRKDPKSKKYKIETVMWTVWFDKNGSHFKDQNSNNALNKSLSRQSPEMKKFIEKYGYYPGDDNKDKSMKILDISNLKLENTRRSAGENLVGIWIAITPLLSVIMDRYNVAFKELTGYNPGQLQLTKRYHFDPHSGEPTLIQIRKAVKRATGGDRPIANVAKRIN